jgi:serine phosphatase RsbU (regulator of sigma subunit)/tetratricopeptide (TPR) repeat protein
MIYLENLAYFLTSTNPDTCILMLAQADSINNNLVRGAKGQWLKALRVTKAEIISLFGSAYFVKSDYPNSIKYDIAAIKMYEELGDSVGIGMVGNNLGNVYNRQGNFKAAAESFYRTMMIQRRKKNKLQEEIAMGNLGLTYVSLGQFDKAKQYLLQSEKLSKTIGDNNGLGMDLLNIGDMYDSDTTAVGYRDSALSYYKQALKIKMETNEREGLAICYDDLAGDYFAESRFDTAISYAHKSEILAKELGGKVILQDLYSKMAGGYLKMKDYKKAFEYECKYSDVTDSIFNENSTKQIAQVQAQYQTEKKQKQIELLQKDKEKQIAVAAAELKKKRTILFSSIAIILLLVGFAFFMYNRFVVIRSQKVVIEEQKALVDEKNKNLEEAKDIIEEKNKDITASIRYAQRIQAAILPPLAEIEKYLPQSFVLYKPKDIVAGDFFFFEHSSDGVIHIAAADCTGHGVPGAMVSVVCSNALNRTVNEFGITEPGKILDKARELVLETFKKSEGEIQDGMDISLLAISIPPVIARNEARLNDQVGQAISLAEKRLPRPDDGSRSDDSVRLQWSGAYNPLWYLSDGEMKEITADKQPIGQYDGYKPFTTHTLNLKKGDTFYLCTDGYADQFGGEKGKKFKYKQLQELLIANAKLPMPEQKQVLEDTFEKWKGMLEQTDDVCIIGIRI